MCDQGPALLVNNRAIHPPDPRSISTKSATSSAPGADRRLAGALFQDRGQHTARRHAARLDLPAGRGDACRPRPRRARPAGGAETIEPARTRRRGLHHRRQWEPCREARGDKRSVICNADEGEPGTFKDRVLLQSIAERVFEGMTLAALVTGANRASSICAANISIC